tara:strand:- start:670 stop:1449 length:780 start_codon:yes stop_codon:yes gene_type:complete
MANHHVDVVADRVKEETSTSGQSDLVLSGAVSGFQAFSEIGDGKKTYYTLEDGGSDAFEVGVGTYTLSTTTLSRDTVIASSAVGDAKISLSGTSTVFCGYPAGESIHGVGSGAKLTSSTAQSISSGALYNVTLDETSDPGFSAVGSVVADTSNSRLKLTEKGLYYLNAQIGLESDDAGGECYFWLTVGTGTTLASQFAMNFDECTIGDRNYGQVSAAYYCDSPDDYVYMNVWVSSYLSSATTTVDEIRYQPQLSAVFIR